MGIRETLRVYIFAFSFQGDCRLIKKDQLFLNFYFRGLFSPFKSTPSALLTVTRCRRNQVSLGGRAGAHQVVCPPWDSALPRKGGNP